MIEKTMVFAFLCIFIALGLVAWGFYKIIHYELYVNPCKQICTKSHDEMMMLYNGNNLTPFWYSVCDEGYYVQNPNVAKKCQK